MKTILTLALVSSALFFCSPATAEPVKVPALAASIAAAEPMASTGLGEPTPNCYQSYCSITCGGNEYFIYTTPEECCAYPITIYTRCPDGENFQQVNYYFHGCQGGIRMLCGD